MITYATPVVPFWYFISTKSSAAHSRKKWSTGSDLSVLTAFWGDFAAVNERKGLKWKVGRCIWG